VVRRQSTGSRDLPVLSVASQTAWETWLSEHHTTSPGVWLQVVKKASAKDGTSYAEALDVALCFGWIDGQKDRLDDDHWLQRFTPRTARSKWSKINREKATKLIAQGKMRSAGRAQVDQAKADGRWDAAYESQSVAVVPDDLRAALEKNRKARAFFSTLDARNRYAILYRIQDAKKPETRARRIEKYVAMLAEEQTIHPRAETQLP
jgi:uncharacterized protein YdeI (YjbR/CyaY-like superfamily)